ncbi:flagellar hook-basal body complex protein FliE [Enterobacter cloacae complex sp. P40RS]|uniref:Flagellar hook-basal body complex protein FliE n=1 Tax=Enterobacter pasteurii TaxID=3029761 RepID=A0ABR9Q640_9ENTR|nr:MULTISPECIES: flagellar hook-basal body complex protein FliE [Enterobacter cloacae complex]MBE4854295.1 flagellar hook-basal body complex protein FliE [Enterobacter pasteurii]MBE4864031.1 flagellar hook-basal body complex protein FliE [Enterobacter cloacae complex sp. P40C2]MBE4876255.1 flagellar hook-basal body complex protein FliE [Enterobacter cloacae complex sp. P40C]
MDKIAAAGINSAQQALLDRMQRTASLASSGAVNLSPTIAPAGDAFTRTAPVSFARVLNSAINNVDALQHSASAKQTAIDMGQSDDLAGAMIESQKASVAFSAMMQVRNKLNSALDEVMNISL